MLLPLAATQNRDSGVEDEKIRTGGNRRRSRIHLDDCRLSEVSRHHSSYEVLGSIPALVRVIRVDPSESSFVSDLMAPNLRSEIIRRCPEKSTFLWGLFWALAMCGRIFSSHKQALIAPMRWPAVHHLGRFDVATLTARISVPIP
jgi:hypothetical protein